MRKSLTILFLITSITFLLTGCGTVAQGVASSYQLENVVPSEYGTDVANIYRVPNKTVQEMVKEISAKYKPVQISKEDTEKMFLVYNDYLVTVMKDVENPNDTLVEVADRQFVKDNYDIGFFEAYMIMNVVEDIFAPRHSRGYRGYIGSGGYTKYGGTLDPKTYKQKTGYYGNNGSVRFGSTGNRTIRGGGPSVGK